MSSGLDRRTFLRLGVVSAGAGALTSGCLRTAQSNQDTPASTGNPEDGAGGAVGSGSPDGSLLTNADFEDDLRGWNVVTLTDEEQEPGSVTPLGGAVRMDVEGTPCSIVLEQQISGAFPAGSSISTDFETGGELECCGHVQIYVSTNPDRIVEGETDRIQHPSDGEHDLSLTVQGGYESGDFFRIRTSIWPGEGHSIIRNVSWDIA